MVLGQRKSQAESASTMTSDQELPLYRQTNWKNILASGETGLYGRSFRKGTADETGPYRQIKSCTSALAIRQDVTDPSHDSVSRHVQAKTTVQKHMSQELVGMGKLAATKEEITSDLRPSALTLFESGCNDPRRHEMGPRQHFATLTKTLKPTYKSARTRCMVQVCLLGLCC